MRPFQSGGTCSIVLLKWIGMIPCSKKKSNLMFPVPHQCLCFCIPLKIWAVTWDFQQCRICDQQRLRPACAYARPDQSLCKSLEHSMTIKLLTEQNLEPQSLKEGCRGSSESTLVKMLFVGNHMSRLIWHLFLWNKCPFPLFPQTPGRVS